jgi:hypothetical protein
MNYYKLWKKVNEADRSGGETPGERWAREAGEGAAEREGWPKPGTQPNVKEIPSPPGTTLFELLGKAMNYALSGQQVKFRHNAGQAGQFGIGMQQEVTLDAQSGERVYEQILRILEPYTQEVPE